METITKQKLIETLASTPGARPVGILATIDARARKTGNPFGAISKTVRAVGFVGADYGNSVKREGARQGARSAGDFIPQSLPWGQWAVNGKVIEHKGEFYLRTQSTPGNRAKQPARVLNYRGENGQFLSREQVAPFLPEVKESAKQEAAGLTETIHVRTYKLSNIQRIRLNGRTFQLV